MASIYEEVEIEDMTFNPQDQIYTYPCPCGDTFRIALEDMWDCGEDIATCPSCTLRIMVVYDEDDLPALREESDAESEEEEEEEEGVPEATTASAASSTIGEEEQTSHENEEDENIHEEEVGIDDMTYDRVHLRFQYLCPGRRAGQCAGFCVVQRRGMADDDEKQKGICWAKCATCQRKVRVLYDGQELPPLD